MTKVIYEDSNILVVNKPAGVVVFNETSTSHTPSLSDSLIEVCPQIKGIGQERNGAVHRLDKDTSGVVLFAKNESMLAHLQQQLLEKKVKKRYITLVYKSVKKDNDTIRSFIDRSPKDRRKQRAFCGSDGKREAITHYHVLQRYEKYTLLEVSIETGRKHQIRCHLSFIGHPVVGDNMYSFKDNKPPQGVNRQLLHAEEISIEISNEIKTFKAPLPEDFEKVLKQLSVINS